MVRLNGMRNNDYGKELNVWNMWEEWGFAKLPLYSSFNLFEFYAQYSVGISFQTHSKCST